MSVINSSGFKILLPARDPDSFWASILEHYAGADPEAWRRLAMLALCESSGWTLERIALAFGQDRGTICRAIQKVKSELRARFERGPSSCEPVDDDLDDDASDDMDEVMATTGSLWGEAGDWIGRGISHPVA